MSPPSRRPIVRKIATPSPATARPPTPSAALKPASSSARMRTVPSDERPTRPPPAPLPSNRVQLVDDLLIEAMDEMQGATDAARREMISVPAIEARDEQRHAVETEQARLPSTDAIVIDTAQSSPPAEARRAAHTRVRAIAIASTLVAGVLVAAFAVGWHRHAIATDSRVSSAAIVTEMIPRPAPGSGPPPARPAPAASISRTILTELPTPPLPTTGTIRVTRKGSRIFLDGHVVGEGPRSLVTTCGRHTLQVGSAGARKLIDVPCGGELAAGR